MRILAWCLAFTMAACGGRPAAAPAPVPTAVVTAPDAGPPPTATLAFCAYGGQAIPTSDPDHQLQVIAVVDVDVAPGAGVAGLEVAAIELSGAEPRATTMRELVSIQRVDPIPAETSWADALAAGAAFDGRLAPGRTRLRIEAWVAPAPTGFANHVRIDLHVGATTITAAGKVAGVWPTG